MNLNLFFILIVASHIPPAFADKTCSEMIEVRFHTVGDLSIEDIPKWTHRNVKLVPTFFSDLPWPKEGTDMYVHRNNVFYGDIGCAACSIEMNLQGSLGHFSYTLTGESGLAEMAAVHELGHVSFIEAFLNEFTPNSSVSTKAQLGKIMKEAFSNPNLLEQLPNSYKSHRQNISKLLGEKTAAILEASMPLQELYADLMMGLFYNDLSLFSELYAEADVEFLNLNVNDTVQQQILKEMAASRDFNKQGKWQEDLANYGRTWEAIHTYDFTRPTKSYIGQHYTDREIEKYPQQILKCVLNASMDFLKSGDITVRSSVEYVQSLNIFLIEKLRLCPVSPYN